MGRNKKTTKMQLKKSLSNKSDESDKIIIVDEQKTDPAYIAGNNENLENVDFGPSLLKHLKNISSVDENVLVWNREDCIDIKANEHLHTNLNINRVKRSMQESPFSKYLEDQSNDLNSISKASIGGVTMIKGIINNTNLRTELLNIDAKIRGNNSNKSKISKKEILNCRTNNVDCESSSSNYAINNESMSTSHKYIPESLNQTNSIKQSSFLQKKPGKYHKSAENDTKLNNKQMVEMNDKCVNKEHNKDELKKIVKCREVSDLNFVRNEVILVDNEKVKQKILLGNTQKDSQMKLPEGNTSDQRSFVVSITDDTILNQNSKSLSEIKTSYGTSLIINDPLQDIKRRRVRPSQFNDFFVGDESLTAMFSQRQNTSTNISSRASSSDNKISTRTRRRSASIDAEAKLLQFFNVENQESLEKQKTSETGKVLNKKSTSVDEKFFTSNTSGFISNKDVLVDDETKNPHRNVSKSITNTDLIRNQTNIIDKNQCHGDKIASDKPKVSDEQKTANKQKLVEWDILIAKQKVVKPDSLIKEIVVKDKIIKVKHKIKGKQKLLDIQNSCTVRKSINKANIAKDQWSANKKKIMRINKAKENPVQNDENANKEDHNEGKEADQSVVMSHCKDIKKPQVIEESVISQEIGKENNSSVCIKNKETVKQEVKIKSVHRRRKSIDKTDIDAMEVMNDDGQLIKYGTAETIVDVYSGGPRVKHVSRQDITNLDITSRKKCIVKTMHRSSRKSDEIEETGNESSMLESNVLDTITVVGSCAGCGVCDHCLGIIVRGTGPQNCHKDKDSLTMNSSTDNHGISLLIGPQGDEELLPKNSLLTLSDQRTRNKERSCIDVYHDQYDGNSSNDEEERDSEIVRCGNINAIKSEDITIMLAYDGGYPIVTSRKTMPNKVLCYSCGSGGDQMIHCVSCAEPFHFFCIEFQFRPKSKEMFVCRNCTRCHLCNKYGTDLKCLKCQLGFHPSCVDRYPPSRSVDRSKWVCYKCAMCVHCGALAEQAMIGETTCDWDSDPWQCGRCARSRKTGLVCPDCDRAHQSESDTIQCSKCAKLVHRQCVGLTEDEFEVVKRAKTVPEYNCRQCDDSRTMRPSVSGLQRTETPMKSYCERRVASLKSEFIDRAVKKERKLLMHGDSATVQSCETIVEQVDGCDDCDMDDDDGRCYQALTRIQMADDYGSISSKSADQWTVTSSDEDRDRNKSVLDGLFITDYETVRHLVMDCLARVLMKTSRVDKYESMMRFMECLSVIIFPWIDIDQCVTTVLTMVKQYSARLTLVVAGISSMVHDGLQREKHVFSTSVGDIEKRLADSLVRGRQEFIEYHSERHLCALVEMMASPGGTRIDDGRQCALCGVGGDDGVEGRMLYGGLDVWVHVNCALWSDEVYETETGALCKVSEAIERGQRHRCDSCHRLGATVSCVVTDCSNCYHLRCALVDVTGDSVLLTVSRTLYCCGVRASNSDIDEQGRVELADMLVLRRVYIPLSGSLSSLSVEDIVVSVGSLCIDYLGTISSVSTNNNSRLSPLGYKARRLFWSVSDPDTLVSYSMSTKDYIHHLDHHHEPPMKRAHSKENKEDSRIINKIKRRPLTDVNQVIYDINDLEPMHTASTGAILHRDNRRFPRDKTTNAITKKMDHCQSPPITNTVTHNRPVSSTTTRTTNILHRPTIINKYFSGTKKKPLIDPIKCSSSLLRRILTRTMQPHKDHRPIIKCAFVIPRPCPPPVNVTPDYIVQLDGQVDDGDNIDDCMIVDDPITEDLCDKASPRVMYMIDGFTTNRSPNYSWSFLARKLSQARKTLGLSDCPIRTGDGWSKFGLDHRSVIYLIQQMIATHQDHFDHDSKNYNDPLQRSLESNKSSRCSTWSHQGPRSRHKDPLSFLLSKTNKVPKSHHDPDNTDVVKINEEDNDDIDEKRLTTEMESLNRGAMSRVTDVRVCLSGIAGRGLFARRQYEPNQLIIEYVGEMIRPVVSECRARQYRLEGTECYLFALDKDIIIDATRMGNAARFINHSCQPNCYSRIIQYKKRKHIIIMALRRIHKGEEFTYDYRFQVEDESITSSDAIDRLVCLCGSTVCRQYLN